jgi:hypothetical protein
MNTTKQLLTIEFRYTTKNDDYKSKTVTIGVFNTLDEVIIEGNKQLEILESKFKLHKFPDGFKANKERFSKNGGWFGSSTKLVTNLAYLKTPFQFFAKITELKYNNLEDSIFEVLEDLK